jgi:hypothetical protein
VEILQDSDMSLHDSSIFQVTATLTSSPDRNPFSSGTDAEDMPDSGDSSNSQESSSNVSFREFLIGDHNTHKFILLDIPLNILVAMYTAVSILPLMQYEVICHSLKQICFYKSFHLLFLEDNCLWSKFFSVLKNCFFKHHPHLDTNEINATIRESWQNRCKLLKGSCRIPFTGHVPLSSDGSYNYLWSGPGVGIPYHIPYGKMLLIHGDFIHCGGLPPQASFDKLYHHVHFYFPTVPMDIPSNAIYLNNFDGQSFSRDYVLP